MADAKIERTKLEKAVKRAATVLAEHLETLPAAEAKAMLDDIHKLAVKSSQPKPIR